MIIVHDYPPMFDEIDAAFNVRGKPVIFSWENFIYNPMSIAVTPELMAHEEVHSRQQLGSVHTWWKHYIADPEFRFKQELPAHHAEYRRFCDTCKDRGRRAAFLETVAFKLAAPLYGNLVTHREARRAIMTLR